jgi:hypothetical protein
MNREDRLVLRAAGRAAHGLVMEGGLPITVGESSKSGTASGVDVSSDTRNASTAASGEDAEKNIAVTQSFPTLKSSLGVRMARPAVPPKMPARVFTSPELKTNPAPVALPAIIEKVHLKAQRPPRASSSRQRTGFPLGAVGLIAAFGTMFVAGLLSAHAFYSTNSPPVTAAMIPATPSPSPALVWPNLLSPGAVSPRGQTLNDLTSDQAFEFADAKLRGIGGPADAEEARYWLRVGVARALGGQRLRWALTQLGTLYARPTASSSDFATARAVWELAAAKQDPVALCFLARLEEGGHSTPPDKALALQLFQQAKEAGQCDGSEQAIERLSR